MLLENTPIEEHCLNGIKVLVKREDLFGQYPAPPLAKLRGARIILKQMAEQGVKEVGVFDTRISKAGQGIAYLCKEFGIHAICGFPKINGIAMEETHRIAAEVLGAELYPLKAGRTAILYARFKKYITEERNVPILPLGLTFPETAYAVECISRAETEGIATIVLSTGTGTIATGVALGTSAHVFGVSCGMNIGRQQNRINKIVGDRLLMNLTLVPPEYAYYDKLDTSSCPFPTSPYYDMKAWVWLSKNIHNLPQPLMFWNIGV